MADLANPRRTLRLLVFASLAVAGHAPGVAAQDRQAVVWDVTGRCFRLAGADAGSCGLRYDGGQRRFDAVAPAAGETSPEEGVSPQDLDQVIGGGEEEMRELARNIGAERLQEVEALANQLSQSLLGEPSVLAPGEATDGPDR